jgi:DNA-binding LacI/PurR family transcriptional regulator
MDAALGELEAQGILSRRQGAGIYVSPNLKRGIALVCDPQFSIDPRLQGFWELIVREARLRVAGSQYDLAFHFSTLDADPDAEVPPLHPGLIEDIRAGRVQGVLTVGLPEEAVDWIGAQGAAVVAFAGLGPVSVNLDCTEVVEMGVGALAARGCRRVALWREPGRDDQEFESAETNAFQSALAAHGLEFVEEWLRPASREGSERSAYQQALEWVAEVFGRPREAWPDALLLTNDGLTRDVMPALQRFDILPSRDIVVASHANSDSPVLRAYEDDLILIEYDSGDIVQTMFDRLEALLRGETVEHPHITIRPKAPRTGQGARAAN